MPRKRRKHKHKILIENPVISSYAAKILLKEKYYPLQEEKLQIWLKFRLELLTRWEEERGGLYCEYCDKGPLIKDVNNYHPYLATLDHVIPRVKGGAEFDENNLVVACNKCNFKKGELDLEEFLNKTNCLG